MANEEHLAELGKGVENWNHWRRRNKEIKPNLSNADLSRANLRGAKLHGAKLIRTDLSKADLSRADLSKADLTLANLSAASLSAANLSAANLTWANLIRADLSFARLSFADLNGANLSNADLSRADLSRADLNGADLSGADLSDTSLIVSLALATNFTSAKLTGACLQNWNINRETKLDNVRCDYAYLESWDSDEGATVFDNRCPSSGNFASGEFALLFKKALDTVDLIFADGIDWKAFFQSFQELRSQYGDENIAIQAIEKKSGGAFVIRLEVPAEVDKGAIESQAKELYERDRQLLEAQYQALLQAKDGQITVYQEWLNSERQRNTDLTGIVQMADKETSKVTQTFNAPIHGGVAGNIEGNQIIYSPEQHQTLAEAAAEIQRLLDHLSQTYSTNTTTGKMQLAAVAIAQIESNPPLMKRILSAIQAGGTAALEQFLNHPAASFVMGAMEDWKQTKEN